jgi:pyridoxine 5-phosphate synthase
LIEYGGAMHRLALDIDPVAYIRNILGSTNPDPVHIVVLAELGGAESIVCYYRDDLKTVNERDVSLFPEVVKSYLNIRTNLTEKNIRNLLTVKPDMVTFVAPGEVSTVVPSSLDLDTYASQIQNYIAELRSNNILSSILIDPDIQQIKLAGKLEFDYVELNSSHLDSATDMDSELALLDEIAGFALAANKIGMGVNISGDISYDNIRELAGIDYLEDIIVGQPIFNKALAIGYEQAVRDMITLL